MQILPTFFVAAIPFVQPSVSATRSDPVLVRIVIDGDTIDVSNVGRVRLLGIDAPEIGRPFDTPAPFGREARDRLAALVLNRWVRLETEAASPKSDAYNRRLAYVMTETGIFINAMMLRDGLARVSARQPLSRLPELERAQAEAQSFRRGIWGATPSIPASSYTQRLPADKAAPTKKKAGPKPRHGRRSR